MPLAAVKHSCPDWCHVCPDMGDGDIMPGCMGGAVYNDLGRCTCDRNNPFKRTSPDNRIKRLEQEVKRLKKLLATSAFTPSNEGEKQEV